MTSNKKAELYLFSATILAGLGWLFSKQAVAELPPLAFIGFRFVCAAVIIAPFGMKQLVRGDRRQFVTAGWIGLLQGLSLSLWIYAVSVSDELGVGAFIMSLSMLFVPIWGWMLFKQRPTRPFWASLPFVSAGLYFLSLSGSFSMSTGELFFFISAAFVALHFICNSHHSQTIPVLYLTCVQFFTGGLLAILFSACIESWPTSISMSTLGWFAASVIPATCLRFFIQIKGQSGTNATNAALLMTLEPLWTVLISVVWLNEVMSTNKILGIVLILTALMVYRCWDLVRVKVKRLRAF
ncbi:DMT family transporter [Vibrio natriegens]|uniref:DMT family transporter n=1 Tax=Vibrio natriegens TaxID=691 RepID=UPI001F90FB7A|nr:DMT family transporter [Vibrio natriegens]CAH0531968.1 hypothetical protein CTH30272_04237 [Catenococcus thiocycli]